MNTPYLKITPISDPPKEDRWYITIPDDGNMLKSLPRYYAKGEWSETAYPGNTHYLAPLAEPVEGLPWRDRKEVPPVDNQCYFVRASSYDREYGAWSMFHAGRFDIEDEDNEVIYWLDESLTPSAKEAEPERKVESLKAQLNAVYEGADQWKQEYNDARSLLQQLWELKVVKNREGKTQSYQERQPKVWEKVEQFLSRYQHQ